MEDSTQQHPDTNNPLAPAPVPQWDNAQRSASTTTAAPADTTGENPNKSYVKTMILTWMFGYFGVDRFYLGKVGTGVAKLLTFGGMGFWVLVDFIITLVGAAREKGDDRPLSDTEKYKPFFVRIVVILLLIYAVIFIFEIIFWATLIPKIDKEMRQRNQNSQSVTDTGSRSTTDLNYQIN
jgi:hypothetical protein